MRIASLYVPSLPLQVFLRSAPQYIGAPVAVVTGGRVTACSRAAWAAGVRPGMGGPAAHELCPGLIAAPVDASVIADQRAAVRAVGDALLGLTPRVDLGGEPGLHHAIYCEVPHRQRGASFGARLVDAARAQGLRARVGIADDRFTAWVAASMRTAEDDDGAPVVSVPRGGSAAFLAPLPLGLLAIPPEVAHVLAAVGVRTLGEFAALPPPSVSHHQVPGARSASTADYQALARGDGGSGLVEYVPSGPVIERVAIGGEVGVGAALGIAAGRVAGRLAGRGLAAAVVAVRAGDRAIELAVEPARADGTALADALGAALREAGDATFVELEVLRTSGEAIARAAATESIPHAVVAEGSAPVPTAAPPPFRLTPPAAAELAMAPRAPHRRTRRGKQRTRAGVAAQSRLFSVS